MKYKIIITAILFIFSFLYLKNSVYLVRENDSLMKEIKEKQAKYNEKPINAIITSNTMIPGISGKNINLTKSYNKMKSINTFKESLLVFDKVLPNKSIKDIFDKVIVSGNPKIKQVSLITQLDDKYCYTENLIINEKCISNHKHTILITKINNNYLTNVKELLKNGQVFFLPLNNDSKELDVIIKYIKNNNYKIVSISELIEE